MGVKHELARLRGAWWRAEARRTAARAAGDTKRAAELLAEKARLSALIRETKAAL